MDKKTWEKRHQKTWRKRNRKRIKHVNNTFSCLLGPLHHTAYETFHFVDVILDPGFQVHFLLLYHIGAMSREKYRCKSTIYSNIDVKSKGLKLSYYFYRDKQLILYHCLYIMISTSRDHIVTIIKNIDLDSQSCNAILGPSHLAAGWLHTSTDEHDWLRRRRSVLRGRCHRDLRGHKGTEWTHARHR